MAKSNQMKSLYSLFVSYVAGGVGGGAVMSKRNFFCHPQSKALTVEGLWWKEESVSGRMVLSRSNNSMNSWSLGKRERCRKVCPRSVKE